MKEEKDAQNFRVYWEELNSDFDKSIEEFIKKHQNNKFYADLHFIQLLIEKIQLVACYNFNDYEKMVGYLTHRLIFDLGERFNDMNTQGDEE